MPPLTRPKGEFSGLAHRLGLGHSGFTPGEQAKTERDKLAAELKAIYPPFEAQLRDLLPRIAANDAQIENIVNRRLPSGAKRLLVAELVARELGGFIVNSVDVPRITNMRLPAFQVDGHDRYAWPRQR